MPKPGYERIIAVFKVYAPVTDNHFLKFLICPQTRQKLVMRGDVLASEDGSHVYPLSESGIPLFAGELCSEDARTQQLHYDALSENYISNLELPHTRVYSGYLDDALLSAASDAVLKDVAEICCGRGEAFQLLDKRVENGVGVDISLNMLESGRKTLDPERFFLVQGDATKLPLEDGCFDSVFIIGGVHHVNDRLSLFREISRILKPGGRFYWREPVSDFPLWKWLRAIIYRISPALDHSTERPLLFEETAPVLEQAGLSLTSWRTYGFFGFCLFMNSDVLVFNRAFRYIPGIRFITRMAVAVDDLIVRIPGLGRAGLQVIGVAGKPTGEEDA